MSHKKNKNKIKNFYFKNIQVLGEEKKQMILFSFRKFLQGNRAVKIMNLLFFKLLFGKTKKK